MMKKMLGQVPLENNILSTDINKKDRDDNTYHRNYDRDEIDLKLYQLMDYYNNQMNQKEFNGIVGSMFHQNESDCLKIVQEINKLISLDTN